MGGVEQADGVGTVPNSVQSRADGRLVGGLAIASALVPATALLLAGAIGWFTMPVVWVVTPVLVVGLQIALARSSWRALHPVGRWLCQAGVLAYCSCWALLVVGGDVEGGIPTAAQQVAYTILAIAAGVFFVLSIVGGLLLVVRRPSAA